jgi:hypothetical protein
MAFMLVRSKVRDFKTWKPAYDAHLPARNDAGLTEKYLLRNADDANEIVIFLKHRTSIERRRLQRPQTSVSGCKNLAWSTSQTSTSSIGKRWVRPRRLPMRPRGGILERSTPAEPVRRSHSYEETRSRSYVNV